MTSTSISITKQGGLYRSLVIALFEKLKKGKLELKLPEGNCLVFGQGEELKASIQVLHNDFFKRCVLYGDIGFGEAYTDGLWESENVTKVIQWFILNVEDAQVLSGSNKKWSLLNLLGGMNKLVHRFRFNSQKGSRENISEHYDLSNDFFSLFLDPSLSYSSAYFKTPVLSLEEAQLAKYQRLCEQLQINASDQVLEIGSGWGANAIYMARKFGCKVSTTTISEQQYQHVLKKVKEEGLQEQVQVLKQDYRDLQGNFDKIVSIEMLEAVGANYYDTFFKKCNSLLNKNGRLGLQVITCPDSRFESLRKGVDWIQKHIFPGSLLPSLSAITASVNRTSELGLVDLKEFGEDYATTLKLWRTEFENKTDAVKKLGFDEYFIRKWRYYFSYCEAAFASKNIYVMQMVFRRPNS